jgi:HAD superfamily hydrolase (TIGR01549 family)
MRFDAVFFDSGGTLWLAPETGSVPAGTSGDEVRQGRFVRVAMSLVGLGYVADASRLAEVLPELEETSPGRFGPTYTYIDLMLALGERLGMPLRPEDAPLAADAYVGPRYRSWLPAGIEQTLCKLDAAGLRLGVISNTYIPGFAVDRLLRGAGLLRFLKTRIYSGDEGLSKPDVAIFRLAEERTGLSGRRVLYVGDKVSSDIAPARAVGWSAALYRSSASDSGGLADFEFDHMPDLTGFVLGG